MPTTNDFLAFFRWLDLNSSWDQLHPLWVGSMPTVPIIEIGAFTGLTLDDEILGKLDQNPLDGAINFQPVPRGLVSVQSKRGRNKELARTSAGSISVSLRNEDRFFDPLVGEFRTQTIPRLPIRFKVSGLTVVTGFVDDWNYSYSPGGQSDAQIAATDGFSAFAREVNAGGSAVSESTGDRLERVLNQATVNFVAGRDIDTGNSTLAPQVLEDGALDYILNTVEKSELGLVFMAKDGTFTFRERLLSTVSDVPVFSSDDSGIPFSSIEIAYGSEDLVNQAIVTGPSGTAISNDATSQVTYGITALELDTQISTLGGQQALADFIIAKFSEPEYRFESLTVTMRGLTPTQRATVLSIEMGDQVDVNFVPNNIPPAITIRNRIIGVSHSINLNQYQVTFNFEKLPFSFFVLDDPVFGKLDEADVVLGF